jgi:hypothetical protein
LQCKKISHCFINTAEQQGDIMRNTTNCSTRNNGIRRPLITEKSQILYEEYLHMLFDASDSYKKKPEEVVRGQEELARLE